MSLPNKFRLDVVKPDGSVLSESVDEAVLPGWRGYFGVLPGHAPYLTLLGTGEMWWRIDSRKQYLALSGGFCEVGPERVVVLAEAAERAEEIDEARAERARSRADERYKRALGGTDSEERERARVALERADLRLSLCRKRGAPAL